MINKEKSISELVHELISEGCRRKASDIHLDPMASGLRVRVRIDGLLSDLAIVSKSKYHEIIAHLKVLAHLRSDEHQLPQDGRFIFSYEDNSPIDVRLSIAPTYFGENAVLRLLQTTQTPHTLSSLGFSVPDQQKIGKALQLHSGMILVTGPTGSGKTTTLYTLLNMVASADISLITLEDPIEYSLSGITQVQIKSQGLTFPSALRSVLRQDPDIIMVGEIRDTETARISINAALTGHLLFSTLHTVDAASVLPRLLDMGIEPYLIASTIKLIISQRLVRKKKGDVFLGRTVIAEVLEVTPQIIEAVQNRFSQEKIKLLAVSLGMTELIKDGLQKVENGITTKEEVFRVIHE